MVKKIKQVHSLCEEEFEDTVNKVLSKMEKEKKKVIDIKYGTLGRWSEVAYIYYEDKTEPTKERKN